MILESWSTNENLLQPSNAFDRTSLELENRAQRLEPVPNSTKSKQSSARSISPSPTRQSLGTRSLRSNS